MPIASERVDAEVTLRKASANGDRSAQVKLGELLLGRAGAEKEGEALLRHVWASAADRRAYDALCARFEETGRWVELEELSRRRVVNGSLDELSRLAHAVQMQGGRDDEASRLFKMAAEKDRKSSAALINVGDLARASGDSAEALLYFVRAVMAGDRCLGARRVGELLEETARETMAEEWFRMSTAEGDADAPAYLARRLCQRQAYDEAEKYYRVAIRRAPTPALRLELGGCVHQSGPSRHAEAGKIIVEAVSAGIDLPTIDEAVDGLNDSAAALGLLSAIYAHLDTTPASRAGVGDLLRRGLLDRQSRLLSEAGRTPEIVALFRGELSQGRREYAFDLAFAIATLDDRECDQEAMALFHESLVANVEAQKSLSNLVTLAHRAGDLSAAIAWMERLLAQDETTTGMVRLASLIEGRNRHADVDALLRRAAQRGTTAAT